MAITGSLSGSISVGQSRPGRIGVLQNMAMTGTTYVLGLNRDDTVGTATAPSLRIDNPNAFRFRWGLTAESHSIQVSSKQARSVNTSSCPSIVVKANASIGINSDIIAYAPSGSSDWTTIGPLIVAPLIGGGVWVELRNNEYGFKDNPAWFDQLITN